MLLMLLTMYETLLRAIVLKYYMLLSASEKFIKDGSKYDLIMSNFREVIV